MQYLPDQSAKTVSDCQTAFAITGLSHARFAVDVSVPSRRALGASLLPSSVKASAICSWFFCRLPPIESRRLLAAPSVWAFVALATTMPAADFCAALRRNHSLLSHASVTRRRPPEVSSTAFDAQPPDLPPAALMDMGFPVLCPLARCRRPLHPVFVHRLAPLLHASFRPRLAATPLRFAIPSPPSGWEENFHLHAVEHARHTQKSRPRGRAAGKL